MMSLILEFDVEDRNSFEVLDSRRTLEHTRNSGLPTRLNQRLDPPAPGLTGIP